MAAGVSKSGSPAASPMTGTPDWTRAVAWSVMAMVFEGLTELTLGLTVGSTGAIGSAESSDLALALTDGTRSLRSQEPPKRRKEEGKSMDLETDRAFERLDPGRDRRGIRDREGRGRQGDEEEVAEESKEREASIPG